MCDMHNDLSSLTSVAYLLLLNRVRSKVASYIRYVITLPIAADSYSHLKPTGDFGMWTQDWSIDDSNISQVL
jgi:hypothetical protein